MLTNPNAVGGRRLSEPSTAMGLSLKDFLDRLVVNLDFKAREVYASAAEVCGMVCEPSLSDMRCDGPCRPACGNPLRALRGAGLTPLRRPALRGTKGPDLHAFGRNRRALRGWA